jgi:hypothetical protein
VKGVDLSTFSYVNPTASALEMGFVTSTDGGLVAPALWYPATWIANVLAQLYYGSILVGPDGVVQLAAGTWVPWVNFTVGASVIIEPCNDTLTMLA